MSTIFNLQRHKMAVKNKQSTACSTETDQHAHNCAQLCVVDSSGAHHHGESWPITRTVYIGRMDADIVLAMPQISRRHVMVTIDSDQYYIQDIGSRNGTALNGQMLDTNRHVLQDGDTIVLAGAIQIKFSDPLATPVVPRLGKLDGLWLNTDTGDVWINARQLQPALSARQYTLLKMLYAANGALISRDDIIRKVWPDTSFESVSNDAVDSLLKRLRKRLSELESHGSVIDVKRGLGVCLSEAYTTGRNAS